MSTHTYPQQSLGSERPGACLCAEQTRKQHTQERGVWGRLKLSSRGGVVPRGQFEKVVMCQGPPQTDTAGWPGGDQEKRPKAWASVQVTRTRALGSQPGPLSTSCPRSTFTGHVLFAGRPYSHHLRVNGESLISHWSVLWAQVCSLLGS